MPIEEQKLDENLMNWRGEQPQPDPRQSDWQSLLQPATRPVWLQAIARLLYLVGYTALQFFMPLIFVNQLGLSATTVGFALAVGSLAGVVGHLLGGYLADSPRYGRKRALSSAAILVLIAGGLLLLSQTLPALLLTNLLMGLSAGCYWTAADAAVVDVTPTEQRQLAFALLVLADSVGTGIGIWAGGLLLDRFHQGAFLFGSSLVPLLLFLLLTQAVMVETPHIPSEHENPLQGFAIALQDRALLLFIAVNVLFTTNIALVGSTLPLYLTRVIPTTAIADNSTTVLSLGSISNLFTWGYIGLGAVMQIPIVRVLSRFPKTRVLMISIVFWAAGFILVWAIPGNDLMRYRVIISLATLSIAGSIYKPFSPAIVAELAPISLRGVYLAISYQCWSIGYFIGPLLGGWAMDQSDAIAHQIWLWVAASTLPGLLVLHYLSKLVQRAIASSEQESAFYAASVSPDR